MAYRSVFFGSAFVFGLAALILPAHASTSGKVELKGSVPAVCEISVTDLGPTLNLVNGENSRKVASVNENCNDHDGYTVSFSSSNKGTMKNKDGDKIDYTISYDKSNKKSLSSKHSVQRNSAKFNANYDLMVNLNSSSTRVAGDYSDTITVTIAAQ